MAAPLMVLRTGDGEVESTSPRRGAWPGAGRGLVKTCGSTSGTWPEWY